MTLLDVEYAALGVPDDEGGFAEFVVDGVSDAEWAAIGPLPRQHGMLGVMLSDPRPQRLPDLRRDPRFGWWPAAHPIMRAFLGMPIVGGTVHDSDHDSDRDSADHPDHDPADHSDHSDHDPADHSAGDSAGDSVDSEGEILGAIYLANPRGRAEFTVDDERLLGVLAAHAAIALTNARLYEQARELTLVHERQRIARELHDAVAQTLFSLRLTAQAAATLVHRDPDRAVAELGTVAELAAEAADELRQVVAELRPRQLSHAGLTETLRDRVALLDRVHAASVAFTSDGCVKLAPKVEEAMLRVAEEALHNALRHSGATHVSVSLTTSHSPASSDSAPTPVTTLTPVTTPTPVTTLTVADDGTGFDTAGAGNAANRLGLVSMRERSRAVRGTLSVTSTPGAGTTVRLVVPGE